MDLDCVEFDFGSARADENLEALAGQDGGALK